PWVTLIENTENVGFSKANNQAMRISDATYHLLLNPDTIVEEDTFKKVLDFMDAHPDAGGLGVKMVDGKGTYLPESKRGLPTPWVAFYKIFGLSKLFPKSPKFNRYYLGHLSAEETHEIEILSGAFMLMRKETLDKVGLLDEAFFMYGEDIDLSYRITQGGYKNYYFPETRIIHYKGESTKSGSLNYVFVFYNAMIIFAKKHFSTQHAKTFTFFINLAIYFRAGLAIAKRFFKRFWLPALDFLVLFFGLKWIGHRYAELTANQFDEQLTGWAYATYVLIWMTSLLYSGGYDKPLKPLRLISGTVVGSIIILVLYALLPEDLRFSRAVILLGSAVVLPYFLLSRWALHWLFRGEFEFYRSRRKRFAIVGHPKETDRIEHLIQQTHFDVPFKVKVGMNSNEAVEIGTIQQLDEVVRVHKVNTVVFSGKDVESKTIIDWMGRLDAGKIEFKIAPPESLSIIGSNRIDTSGDLFILDTNSINRPANRRNKRTLDVLSGLLVLGLSPLLILFQKRPIGLVPNLIQVLFGNKTWVGYHGMGSKEIPLPKLKDGVLTLEEEMENAPISEEIAFLGHFEATAHGADGRTVREVAGPRCGGEASKD
ncbi:MAG: glycosyltransferase, partial [Bacteroidota bacterium]